MDKYFCRNFPAISEDEFALLRRSHVCIVGCGGLGCCTAEMLARIGVGTLTIIDGDVFTESNFNRQLYARHTSLGRNKAIEAAAQIFSFAPETSVIAVPEYFTPENAHLLNGCSLVVDALDSGPSRLRLAAACAQMNLPLVHGAVDGWRVQLSVILPGSSIMERLYSSSAESSPCSVLSFTTTYCASLQAAEAVKLLLGKESALVNKLLCTDLLNGTLDLLSV